MKHIIITIATLLVITALLFATLSIVSAKKGGSREHTTQKKIEEIEVNAPDLVDVMEFEDSQEAMQKEKEVQDDTKINVIDSSDSSKNQAGEERYEVSRTRCEDCGYDMAYYVIEYSDGTTEIVDEK